MKRKIATRPRLVRVTVGALLIAAETAHPSSGKELEGVHFADQYRPGDVTMRLSCVGLLRYKLFIKAYVAALYLGDGAAAGDVLADVPKRIERSYFWGIRDSDFGTAGDQILAQNVDGKTFAALRPRLDRINALYRDVRPGDRYSLARASRGPRRDQGDRAPGNLRPGDLEGGSRAQRRRAGGSIVSPQVEPHCGQTYSHLSPFGRTRSRRFRTGTAVRHFGQARSVAFIRSKDARGARSVGMPPS
jgi:hypothetical protein